MANCEWRIAKSGGRDLGRGIDVGDDGWALGRLEAQSSVVEKLSEEERAALDTAIVERRSGTYQATYDKLKLGERGVSFSTFYRYARRLRSRVAMLEAGALALPAGADVPAALPKLLAARLMEALVLEDPSPRHLQRLADAYRIAANVHIHLGRHASKQAMGAIEDGNRLCKIVDEFREMVTRDLEQGLGRKTAALKADGADLDRALDDDDDSLDLSVDHEDDDSLDEYDNDDDSLDEYDDEEESKGEDSKGEPSGGADGKSSGGEPGDERSEHGPSGAGAEKFILDDGGEE